MNENPIARFVKKAGIDEGKDLPKWMNKTIGFYKKYAWGYIIATIGYALYSTILYVVYSKAGFEKAVMVALLLIILQLNHLKRR
jgi:uncharacterized membrane protein